MKLIKLVLKTFRTLNLSDYRDTQLSKYFANIIFKNIRHNEYSKFILKNNLQIVDKVESIKLYSFIYFPFNLKKIQFIHLIKQKI